MNSDTFRKAWAKENIIFTHESVGDGMRWFVQTQWVKDRIGGGWYGRTWEEAIDKAILATNYVFAENPS